MYSRVIYESPITPPFSIYSLVDCGFDANRRVTEATYLIADANSQLFSLHVSVGNGVPEVSADEGAQENEPVLIIPETCTTVPRVEGHLLSVSADELLPYLVKQD